jgi:hypothetical protein
VTKIIYLILINLVTPKARAKHEPLVQQTGHWPLIVEEKLILSSSFRCDQIYTQFRSQFVVLLKSDLSVLQTHLWGQFIEQKLMLIPSFRCYQIHNCHRWYWSHFVVLPMSDLDVQQKPTSGWPTCYLHKCFTFSLSRIANEHVKNLWKLRLIIWYLSCSFVTNLQQWIKMLSYNCWLAKSTSGHISKPKTRGQFFDQKLMLSPIFRCYQTHNCHRYNFGHTLLRYLNRT